MSKSGYEELSNAKLEKIYKKKVDKLIFARQRKDTIQEQNILYEMRQLEILLKKDR